MKSTARALVIGAGISGIRAALDLAEAGHSVLLADRDVVPGGLLLSLDRQFPDNHCGICRMLPRDLSGRVWNACMRRGFGHPNIEFLPGIDVQDIQGVPGNLAALAVKNTLRVDPEKCTGCLECIQACPVTLSGPEAPGLGPRRAIYPAAPHRPANFLSIDAQGCILCGKCLEACPAGAIELTPEQETEPIENLSLAVLTTGVEYYSPQLHNLYGSGCWPDVITTLDFERLVGGVGHTRGKLLRPSDDGPVRKAAWIQCVGSRNLKLNADHCSGICCMISLKQAQLAREKGVQCSVFYMDMRTPGKQGQKYQDLARENGIRLIRCRPHSIERDHEKNALMISYAPAPGKQADEDFDLVVLSVGRDPEHRPPAFAGKDGVFTTQGCQRVLDIPSSLIQASSSAGRAIRMHARDNPGAQAETAAHDLSGPRSEVLVVGGGPAGLSAALSLAEQNMPVMLVEREDRLGGSGLQNFHQEVRKQIETLLGQVQDNPLVDLLPGFEVISSSGRAGGFTTLVRKGRNQDRKLKHGAVILATGGEAARIHDQGSRVTGLADLADDLSSPDSFKQPPGCVVFVLCHQARQEPRNYCSRTCCRLALECALKIRSLWPETLVAVFYRDIMLQGDDEQLYTRARKAGVRFIPYEKDTPPDMEQGQDRIMVRGFDPFLRENTELEADLVALAGGVTPASGPDLARIFNVDCAPEGFLQELDPKFRPVDSTRTGIFICGLARSPVSVQDAMLEGEAAAQGAVNWILRSRSTWPQSFVRVRAAFCSLCGMCLQACPFEARYKDEETGAMEVDPLACQGCGACVAACPNNASIWTQHSEEAIDELN